MSPHAFGVSTPLSTKDPSRQPIKITETGYYPRNNHHPASSTTIVKRELILSALRRAGWIQAEAARLLGINRWKMLRLVRKHDMEGLIRARRDRG